MSVASLLAAISTNLPKVKADNAQVGNIMNNIIFPIAGGIAVLFIIIGALQYVTSQGDSSTIQRAKEMILNAIIGLVIVIFAFAIIQIVIRVGQG